jgi:hypothetical protein
MVYNSRAVSEYLYTDAVKNGEEKRDYRWRLSFGTGNQVPEIWKKGKEERDKEMQWDIETKLSSPAMEVLKDWMWQLCLQITTPHINISKNGCRTPPPPQRL